MPKQRLPIYGNCRGASLVEVALLVLLILLIAIPSIKAVGHIPKKAVCGYMHGGEQGFDYYDPDTGHCPVDPMDPDPSNNYF
jgi:hypothetical protein